MSGSMEHRFRMMLFHKVSVALMDTPPRLPFYLDRVDEHWAIWEWLR